MECSLSVSKVSSFKPKTILLGQNEEKFNNNQLKKSAYENFTLNIQNLQVRKLNCQYSETEWGLYRDENGICYAVKRVEYPQGLFGCGSAVLQTINGDFISCTIGNCIWKEAKFVFQQGMVFTVEGCKYFECKWNRKRYLNLILKNIVTIYT